MAFKFFPCVGIACLLLIASYCLRRQRRCTSVLFAAHDPGAQNNIRALHQLSSQDKLLTTRWLDLRANGVLLKPQTRHMVQQQMGRLDSCLCVTGFSTNHAELVVADACAAAGAKTLTVLEFLPGQRLDGATSRIQSLEWLVGTHAAARDLAQRFSASHVHVTGSAAMEALSQRHALYPPIKKQLVLRMYRRHFRRVQLPSELVAVFLPAPEAYVGGLIGARPAIEALLADTCRALLVIRTITIAERHTTSCGAMVMVIRMHPRTSSELADVISHAANGCACALIDSSQLVDNESLIRAAALVISHGSTTLVESLLLGSTLLPVEPQIELLGHS